MTSVVAASWKAVRPHIPLIKFRKGGLNGLARGSPQPAVVAAASPLQKPAAAAATTNQSPVLEEWQVPLKYRREPISEEEMEYINRGGPA